MTIPPRPIRAVMPLAPPGWHRDTTGEGWVWWDGYQWSSGPHTTPQTTPPDTPKTWFPEIVPLRFPAAVVSIAFVIGLTVLSRLPVDSDSLPAVSFGLAIVAISTFGMPLVAIWASRRCGTGNLTDDLGLRIRWIDLPLGIAAAVALTISLILFNLFSALIRLPNGSNLTEVQSEGRNLALFVTLGILAVIIAPLTEEVLFRGAMLRGLGARFGGWVPAIGQALVFGGAHITPSEGWGNVNLVLSLAIMGFGFAMVHRLTGRLGTSIVAHAVFNASQLGLLWISLG